MVLDTFPSLLDLGRWGRLDSNAPGRVSLGLKKLDGSAGLVLVALLDAARFGTEGLRAVTFFCLPTFFLVRDLSLPMIIHRCRYVAGMATEYRLLLMCKTKSK